VTDDPFPPREDAATFLREQIERPTLSGGKPRADVHLRLGPEPVEFREGFEVRQRAFRERLRGQSVK
jgi:hypothetical protein